MGKEDVIRDQSRHRDNAPSGGTVENIAEATKIGNAVSHDTEPVQPFEIFAASAPDQQTLLSLEKRAPDRVLLFAVILPVLFDGKIRPDRGHRPLRNYLFSKCDRGSSASIGRFAPASLLQPIWERFPGQATQPADQLGQILRQLWEIRFTLVVAFIHVERPVDFDLQGVTLLAWTPVVPRREPAGIGRVDRDREPAFDEEAAGGLDELWGAGRTMVVAQDDVRAASL